MREFDVMYVTQNDNQEILEAVKKHIESIGTIDKCTQWNHTGEEYSVKGYYTLISFSCESIRSLDALLRSRRGEVLRHLIVSKGE